MITGSCGDWNTVEECTEEDKEYIRPYVEATLNSLADRYTFTAEEEKKFEDSLRNNYGYPRYEDCKEYITKHNE